MSILYFPRGPGKTTCCGVSTSCCPKLAALTSPHNLEMKSSGSHPRSHVKKKKKERKREGWDPAQLLQWALLSMVCVHTETRKSSKYTLSSGQLEPSSSSSIHTRRVALSESPSLSFLLNLKKWDDSSCLTKVWRTKSNKGRCLAQSKCLKKNPKMTPGATTRNTALKTIKKKSFLLNKC